MSNAKVTAGSSPNRWTEAELNVWIDDNAKSYYSEAAKTELALNRWIEVATSDLSQMATDHIGKEVHQNIDREVERLNLDGLSRDDALKYAMALLGNPQVAKK